MLFEMRIKSFLLLQLLLVSGLMDVCTGEKRDEESENEQTTINGSKLELAMQLTILTPECCTVFRSNCPVRTPNPLWVRSVRYLHRGRHAKIFGWAKSEAHERRSTSDLCRGGQRPCGPLPHSLLPP